MAIESRLCKYAKTHTIVQFQQVKYMVCKLPLKLLNKKDGFWVVRLREAPITMNLIDKYAVWSVIAPEMGEVLNL